MKVTRDKLKPFNWDPLAAAAATPGSPTAKPAAAADRTSLAAPSPLTLVLEEGEEEEGQGGQHVLSTWTPSLLTVSGQEEVWAQMRGRPSDDSSKAGAEAGAGGKRRRKKKAGWSAKKKQYTARQWATMMRFAQQVRTRGYRVGR